ncbi:tubulin-tyrosine ligase family [Achlya hypogyna]|uniref:Tubulin-tyrosine ligase family n=1 Tax=Achlya hypogyna TaxID=1202772 RepID=A0A1V9ZGF3_ACHHY|nr:tubulin-tyrosine ligase family [Achlya hypogyna]
MVPFETQDAAVPESFPLLPLGLIPKLESAVLATCKIQLEELLQTLGNDSDDVSLGQVPLSCYLLWSNVAQYVRKEIAVIVMELEDRRARQRIAQLVAGTEATGLSEIGPKTSHQFEPLGASASLPSSTASHGNTLVKKELLSPATSLVKPLHAQSGSSAMLQKAHAIEVSKPIPVTSKAPEPSQATYDPRRLSVKEMLAKAKATRIAANDPSTRFIIQGVPKAKKRTRIKPKAPREETPEERLQNQREARRREAELRKARKAKLVLEAQRNDDGSSSDSASDADAVGLDSDEYVDDSVHDLGPPKPEEAPLVPAVEQDKRITQINNVLCCIQATENLEHLQTAPRLVDTVDSIVSVSTNEGSEILPVVNISSPEPTATSPVKISSQVVPDGDEASSHLVVSSPPKPLNDPATPDKPITDYSPRGTVESVLDPAEDDALEGEEEEDAPPAPVYDKATFHSTTAMELLDHAVAALVSREQPTKHLLPEWFQAQRDSVEKLAPSRVEALRIPPPSQSVGRQLLDSLAIGQSQIKACRANLNSVLASLAPPPSEVAPPDAAPTKISRPKSSKAARPTVFRSAPSNQTEETTLPRSTKSTPRLLSKVVPVLPLAQPVPTRDITDYSKHFKTFLCIMTSFYEKSRDGASGNPKEALQQGEMAMRFQLKLYTVWKNIMHDYATVFGVDGLLKTNRELGASYVYDGSQSTPFTAQYRINSSSRLEVFGIVAQALKKMPDWEELPVDLGLNTTWNLLWTWSKPRVDRQTLLAWQKVNHFAGAKALTRKDMLKKSLHRYTSLGGERMKSFDIAPETFILPNDYIPFVQAFKRRGDEIGAAKNIWIMKPVALSRGRGISLLNDLGQVAYGEAVVVQKYIENPLLLDGYKFDLRLYVLVTSFNPLEVRQTVDAPGRFALSQAFFYQEGFVRICTHRYSTDATEIGDLFMHLTNSSIQKYGHMDDVPDNPVNNASTTEAGGTKASLAYLWSRLAAAKAPVGQIKEDIIHVILKSLVAGEDAITYQVNSFDVYGYDILLDDNYRPWLIEINSSPSMARENNLDYVIKDALMHDTMRVVRPLHFDRAALISVLKRRIDDLGRERKRPSLLHPIEAEERAKRQLNEDLDAILHGAVPREYGEMPEELGNFMRIAPSSWHSQVMKLKRTCFRDKTKP